MDDTWNCGILWTLKASSLSNRGYERSEHPRIERVLSTNSTPAGCPLRMVTSDVSLVVLYAALLEQGNQFVASREFVMVLLLVDNILYDPLFFCLRIGQGTIALFPFLETRETVAVRGHKVVGGNLEVVYKRGNGYRWVQRDKHVDMIWHTVDAIEFALVVLAEAKDVHVEVAFVCLVYGCCTLMGAQDNMIDELCVCHSRIDGLTVDDGAPLQGAVGCAVTANRGCSLRSYPRLLSDDAFSVYVLNDVKKRKCSEINLQQEFLRRKVRQFPFHISPCSFSAMASSRKSITIRMSCGFMFWSSSTYGAMGVSDIFLSIAVITLILIISVQR